MSLENAKRFIDSAGKDEALRQRLGAVREPAEVVRLAVQAGSERGLPFTAEEFVASIGTGTGANSGELNDDQLESVAGGLASLSPSQLATFWSRLGGGLGGGLKSTESTLSPSQQKT